MPVIGCLEIFQNSRSPQPITGIIYSPGCHELKIGSAAEDTLSFIPLVLSRFTTLFGNSFFAKLEPGLAKGRTVLSLKL